MRSVNRVHTVKPYLPPVYTQSAHLGYQSRQITVLVRACWQTAHQVMQIVCSEIQAVDVVYHIHKEDERSSPGATAKVKLEVAVGVV